MIKKILNSTNNFQDLCVLGAAAELGVFSIDEVFTADKASHMLNLNTRATAMLLDALTALEVMEKKDGNYKVPDNLKEFLSSDSLNSILPGILHRLHILRRWAELSDVVKTGKPTENKRSRKNMEAFINAMHVFSADSINIIDYFSDMNIKNILDVGGASGSWTIGFLKLFPDSKATIFDVPEAIEIAKKRTSQYSSKIELKAGNFFQDDFPTGFDFAWISAIIHQFSRENSRTLYKKVYNSLDKDGTIAIRDIVMNPQRTAPKTGALFAINMLVNTPEGMTYTFEEIKEDLTSEGFSEIKLIPSKSFAMNSMVIGKK